MAKRTGKGKFLEGALAGVALGVAASIFLASKKGKELKDNLKDVSAEFYKYISPKLKKMKKMGEKEYKEFMKQAVSQYIKTKKISGTMAEDLIKEVQQSWKHLSKHIGM